MQRNCSRHLHSDSDRHQRITSPHRYSNVQLCRFHHCSNIPGCSSSRLFRNFHDHDYCGEWFRGSRNSYRHRSSWSNLWSYHSRHCHRLRNRNPVMLLDYSQHFHRDSNRHQRISCSLGNCNFHLHRYTRLYNCRVLTSCCQRWSVCHLNNYCHSSQRILWRRYTHRHRSSWTDMWSNHTKHNHWFRNRYGILQLYDSRHIHSDSHRH